MATMLELTKIGESANCELHDLERNYYSLLVGNKIWIFSRKYFKQPTYHCGHDVLYTGGYSSYFDLNTRKWAPKKDFSKISDKELLAETIFVFRSNIYLILYVQHGDFEVEKLMLWDVEKRDWQEVTNLKVGDGFQGTDCTLSPVGQEPTITDSLLFFSVSKSIYASPSYALSILSLSFDDRTHAPSFTLVQHIPDDPNSPGIMPLMGVRYEHYVYLLGGVHGCGFMFQPNSLLIYDEKEKKCRLLQLQGEGPHFCSSGARQTLLLPSSGLWVHATGRTRRGISDSVYNGQIWNMSLKEHPPMWTKLPVEVPETDGVFLTIGHNGSIYMDDQEKGVLMGKI